MNREVFRLTPPLILWWVWVVFAAVNVADFAIQGAHGSSARFVIMICVILVTVTGLAYALALRPRVIAEQAGLTIVNPFRDHHVPWAAIQAVDTGDWVRVHYLPGSTAASRPGSTVASRPASSAASRAISCWALYISARTKRRSGRFPGGAGPAAKRWPGGLPNPRLPGSSDPAGAAGRPGARSGSRLPEEAKYLASLPAAQAIAVSLDTRAGRERTRAARSDPGGLPHPVTARWAWAPVAAVVLPALALLIVAVALGP